MVKQVLGLGLMILVVLALGACEADEWQLVSKPRPLPEDPTLLYPDVYRSEEFEPSLSLRVGQTHHWKRLTLCKSRAERGRG
jgi:hypothetical protein